MDIRNCPKCGKIFTFIKTPICEKCEKEEELIFEKVKKFVDENPNSNIYDIVNGTGASEKKILSYIKNGRLEIILDNIETGKRCEKCNKKIISGRFCDKCLLKLVEPITTTKNKNIKEMRENERKKSFIKMHTYKKNK